MTVLRFKYRWIAHTPPLSTVILPHQHYHRLYRRQHATHNPERTSHFTIHCYGLTMKLFSDVSNISWVSSMWRGPRNLWQRSVCTQWSVLNWSGSGKVRSLKRKKDSTVDWECIKSHWLSDRKPCCFRPTRFYPSSRQFQTVGFTERCTGICCCSGECWTCSSRCTVCRTKQVETLDQKHWPRLVSTYRYKKD